MIRNLKNKTKQKNKCNRQRFKTILFDLRDRSLTNRRKIVNVKCNGIKLPRECSRFSLIGRVHNVTI